MAASPPHPTPRTSVTHFALPDVDGTTHEPGDAPATVVAFTCNHCPYALAWHERLISVGTDYADKGVKFLAINSNDPNKAPTDSLEASARRVADGDFGSVPYLYDDTQEVAKQFGAR